MTLVNRAVMSHTSSPHPEVTTDGVGEVIEL